MWLKLDISKAYDKLSWKFMKEIHEAYGFHWEWVWWIMNIASTTFFSILLNGSPTKMFQPSRGIIQGNLLSPFIFILVVEGLSRVIKDKVEKRELKGLNLHTISEVISHHQFVDDTVLMGHSSVPEEQILKKFLNNFSISFYLKLKNSSLKSYFLTCP